MLNWDKYDNFTEEEFKCKHTGLCFMDESFMSSLQMLRSTINEPFIINSGYRHKTHPEEINKKTIGEHTLGKAADIKCNGHLLYSILKLAPQFGFHRIGIDKKSGHKFGYVHLGAATEEEGFTINTVWTY